ncbi:ankyrin repeat domain-containing protein [Paramagnetospirillum caucaseum]|nr:ankyrin repeat domain-containing protein [Paramagnetospirillum caucaseum]
MRHELADAAKNADWDKLFALLTDAPELVNAIRPGGASHYTPLHQAAYAGAPEAVVQRLLNLGASRTLKTQEGETAQDVARRKGHVEMEKALAPEHRVVIHPEILSRIEGQLHRLIRGRANALVDAGRLRLPMLECLTELNRGTKTWFAVPGMYGGFSYWFPEDQNDCLSVESWCRVADGSERGHVVYADRIIQVMTGMASGDQTPAFCILSKVGIPNLPSYEEAYWVADGIVDHIAQPDIASKLVGANALGVASQVVQDILLPHLKDSGFSSEKTGLFAAYDAKNLRPDYFKPCRNGGGMLVEVERGKTLANNMDLLDLWKCHICPDANYLIIIVPKIRKSENGNRQRVFERVVSRLTAFFQYGNEVNVDAAFIIGY